MATMTIDEALAHADAHAVPGQAMAVLAAEVRELRDLFECSIAAKTMLDIDLKCAKAELKCAREPVAWAWDYCGINVSYNKEKPSFLDETVLAWPLFLAPREDINVGMDVVWVPADDLKPELSEDVLVTILIDGIDTDWRAGFWDGQHWYTLDTEIDEPIQVNAGCNFFVTHWARVQPAEVVR